MLEFSERDDVNKPREGSIKMMESRSTKRMKIPTKAWNSKKKEGYK